MFRSLMCLKNNLYQGNNCCILHLYQHGLHRTVDETKEALDPFVDLFLNNLDQVEQLVTYQKFPVDYRNNMSMSLDEQEKNVVMNQSGWMTYLLSSFFMNRKTGEWRPYLPTKESNMFRQIFELFNGLPEKIYLSSMEYFLKHIKRFL